MTVPPASAHQRIAVLVGDQHNRLIGAGSEIFTVTRAPVGDGGTVVFDSDTQQRCLRQRVATSEWLGRRGFPALYRELGRQAVRRRIRPAGRPGTRGRAGAASAAAVRRRLPAACLAAFRRVVSVTFHKCALPRHASARGLIFQEDRVCRVPHI